MPSHQTDSEIDRAWLYLGCCAPAAREFRPALFAFVERSSIKAPFYRSQNEGAAER